MQMQERRREVLRFFYKHQNTGSYHNPYGGLPAEEWAEIAAVCRYWRDKGCLNWMGSARPDLCECGMITALGIDHYEGTNKPPQTVTYQFENAQKIQIGNNNTMDGD